MSEYIDELKREIDQEENIEENIEDSDAGEDVSPTRYDITSYGIDFDVEGIVKRLKRGDIYIPDFQRNFVWKMTESSRFIESLLLGLPVPGIFLAQDPETKKMLVIDGQQRLLSLAFFFGGYFNPKEEAKSNRVFKLTKVQEPYLNQTYDTLDNADRINIENCVIHATVVKQDSPSNDDTSIYHIFERLNSGGRKLTAQEIRTAVYHGELLELLNMLNSHPNWRTIFGSTNDRMRDQELILRFFAMLEEASEYKKPMVDFLNIYAKKNRNPGDEKLRDLHNIFTNTIDSFHNAVGQKIFRPVRALNVAFYESAMVGLARRLKTNGSVDNEKVRGAYTNLSEHDEFKDLISKSTTDITNVTRRLEIATDIFSEV